MRVFVAVIITCCVCIPLTTLGVEWFASEVKTAAVTAMTCLALLGVIFVVLVASRDFIFKKLKLRVEVALQDLIEPVVAGATAAIDGDKKEVAVQSGELGRRFLSRYTWLTTRRFMLTAIGGLFVTVAALAGSALLVQQNSLLKDQTSVLEKQLTLLESQNKLVTEQNLLSEASRRSTLNFEVTAILTAIDREMAELVAKVPDPNNPPDKHADLVQNGLLTQRPFSKPYWLSWQRPGIGNWRNEQGDIAANPRSFRIVPSERLIGRIVSLSRALKPYKFIDNEGNLSDPLSPERAQLAISLFTSGIHLSSVEQYLDLNYADFRGVELIGFDFAGMILRNANFSGASIRNSVFQSCDLSDSNFENADLYFVDFSYARLPNPEAFRGSEVNFASLEGAVVPQEDWLPRTMKLCKAHASLFGREEFLESFHGYEIEHYGTPTDTRSRRVAGSMVLWGNSSSILPPRDRPVYDGDLVLSGPGDAPDYLVHQRIPHFDGDREEEAPAPPEESQAPAEDPPAPSRPKTVR